MAVQNKGRKNQEDNAAGLVMLGAALLIVAGFMWYMLFASPMPGTAMGTIREALEKLGGCMAYAIPLWPAWGGVMSILSARGVRGTAWRYILDALTLLLLFAAVHVFFAEQIVLYHMSIRGFANFVVKSHETMLGAGALGALLAWPLYNNLGIAGAVAASIVLMAVCQVVTGRIPRLVNKLSESAERAKEDRREREFIERYADRRKPRPEQRRPEQLRPKDRRPEQRRPASGKPKRRRPEEARRRPEDPTLRRRRDAQVARRSRLYMEDIDPQRDTGATTPEEMLHIRPEEERSYTPDMPSGLKNKAKKNAPVAPAAPVAPVDVPVEAADVPEDIEEEAPSVPEDLFDVEEDESVADIDAFRIEPDAYETEDEDDEPPFDVPEDGQGKHAKPEPRPARPEMKLEPDEDEEEYAYPPVDLLEAGEAADTAKFARRDMEKAELLISTLDSFGISAKLTGVAHGPAVTRFELQPAPGIKVSRITNLADDIAMNLAAMSVRIEAPIPGKAAVGVEIPNDKVEMVHLRDVLESQEARKHPSKIAVGLGKDNSGRYIVADVAKMPHVLIAGQTGSGKSVCINAIIASILFRAAPSEVRMILIDPKVVELSIYNDIPHLVCPVVTDPKKAASALGWAVAEMTKRYKQFAERGVRDIKGYNKSLKPGEALMPQMVIIIDELADLMMVSPGEVEDSICRLAQLARACGIHLVIATQRPSVNVITGIIKANIPTRIAFSVASQVDSRTMIDHAGAEKLLGYGDMLYVPNGSNKPMRVQGAWVSDEEVQAIVNYIKQCGEAEYDPDAIEHIENGGRTDAEREEFAEEYDPKLPEAVEIVIDMGQASISMLQRRMRIGYARAGRLIDEMAQRGIVSEADGAKPREVLITRDQAALLFGEQPAE